MKKGIIFFSIVFLLLVIAVLVIKIFNLEIEDNTVEYKITEKLNNSNILEKGYIIEEEYVTLYFGSVNGNNKYEVENITRDNDIYTINIINTINKESKAKYITPSIKIKLDKKPSSIKVLENGKDLSFSTIDNSINRTATEEEKIEASKCVSGTYYDRFIYDCTICPMDTYSLDGSVYCTECPLNTCSPEGSKSINDCKPCN